ncbi:hypothetical protein EXIGLDRAFT_385607 [Exidia glandulosa HHB12029]|uniref:Uncharacterized protein n=1 Tax=Exidia glandulosa HHB12029 TaxID=1314781 RepID=A0A165BW05_EXIGL|nr:hypothetical protein EXIGLDRAFT_385607 [Exidia glandulosa HHB12029]
MSRIGTIRIEFFEDLSVTRVKKYLPNIELPRAERPYKTVVPHHVKMCVRKKRAGESSWERSQGRSDVRIPDDVLPYRVLEFKYRPPDYLESHGIIPPNQSAPLVPVHAKSAVAGPQRQRRRVNIEADADSSERAEASRQEATTSTVNEEANEQAPAQVASTSRITPEPSPFSSVFTQPASASRENVATAEQPPRSVVKSIQAPLSTPKPNTVDARQDKHAREEEVKDEEPGTNRTAGASANGQGTRAPSRTPSSSYTNTSIFARPSCPHDDTSGKRKRDVGESGQAVSSTPSSSGSTRSDRGDKPASRKKVKIEDSAPSVKGEDGSASLRTNAHPQPGPDDKAVILERIKSMEKELTALRRMLKAPAPISQRAMPPTTTIDLTGEDE